MEWITAALGFLSGMVNSIPFVVLGLVILMWDLARLEGKLERLSSKVEEALSAVAQYPDGPFNSEGPNRSLSESAPEDR